MSDWVPVVAAVCGLSVVCIGLIVAGLLALVRLTGFDIRSILGNVGEIFAGKGQETGVIEEELKRRRRPNFRTQADSLDFDSALARYRRDQPPAATRGPAAPPPPGRPGVDPRRMMDDDFRPLSSDQSDYIARRRSAQRRRRRDPNEDEIFGGMLDEDGDGEPNF
jgi:hypothetical protein